MRRLTCGCCGDTFQGKQDPGHDEGYGECPACVEWMKERNEERWDELEKQVLGSFKDEANREKFLKLTKAQRRGVMLKMMNDGVITWKIELTKVG